MIKLTENAKERIKTLSQRIKDSNSKLKLVIKGESCSDNLITLTIDSDSAKSDKVFNIDGINVSINKKFYSKMNDITIDYSNDLFAKGFKVIKPIDKKNCNCGF